MATFYESVYLCTIYALLNQVTNQYAFNLGQAQVRRKIPQNNVKYLDAKALNNLLLQRVGHSQHDIQSVQNQRNQHYVVNREHIVNAKVPQHRSKHLRYIDHDQHRQFDNYQKSPAQHDPSDKLSNRQLKIHHFPPNHQRDHFHLQNQRVNYKVHNPLNPAKPEIHIVKDVDQPRPVKKIDEFRMQRVGYGGQRQTFKHFRYSRIRRYYTLSTASMSTYKKINYTTRLMYTSPTTRTTSTYRYTTPAWGSSRQTILHTRMTESDERGRELFASGSLEYKDDSFDKPPTEMVAYDSQQVDPTRNATVATDLPAVTTAKTTPVPKTTKKISSELISLESSSEEKPSSSETKDDESSAESEDYGTEKLYGDYGYHRKYNNTPNPFTIVTYANIREVPGMDEMNLTSAEVAFWEANASYILDKYFPSSELELISNYSEENLVRSFFHGDNIEAHHLDFYKWYYKLLTDPERLRIIYNRTVLEEPDYKNLSQFTPFPIPDDLQRYYMFINQMENEIDREAQQEERVVKTQREAEQHLDRILGDGAGGRPAAPYQSGRLAKKRGDLDVSQILQMVDNQQSDSMMPGGGDSSEGFIDASRYKRDVSKFEPD